MESDNEIPPADRGMGTANTAEVHIGAFSNVTRRCYQHMGVFG